MSFSAISESSSQIDRISENVQLNYVNEVTDLFNQANAAIEHFNYNDSKDKTFLVDF